ncbi:hypothetical protein, partial [Pseudomonas aeruginosa]|uniref:hypothetical protein n=1 Tax=Pseudomonas aeruginosa TaxID=287 RepID=UPI0015EBE890
STQHLRKDFKNHIDILIEAIQRASNVGAIQPNIQTISDYFEKTIQEKIRLLESDFHDKILMGDYLHSVTESFDDLERLMRTSKTLTDSLKGNNKEELLVNVKEHHKKTLVPLLNILSKLENDYIAITSN